MYNESITDSYVRNQLDFILAVASLPIKILSVNVVAPDLNHDFVAEGRSCVFNAFINYEFEGQVQGTQLQYPYEIDSSFIFARPNKSLQPKVAINIAEEMKSVVAYESGVFFTRERIYYSFKYETFKYKGNHYTLDEFTELSKDIILSKELISRLELVMESSLEGKSTIEILKIAVNIDPKILNQTCITDLVIRDASSGLTNFLYRERFKIRGKLNNYYNRYHRISLNPIQSWIYKFFQVNTSAQLQTPSVSNPISIESNSKKLYIKPFGDKGNNFIKLNYNYSLYGVICPVKTIESAMVNIKNELASNIEFENGSPVISVYNKNREIVKLSISEYVKSVVICSESWNYDDWKPNNKVTYCNYGKLKVADSIGLDYDYIHMENGEFSIASSCIPLLNSTDSSRGSLGSHMIDQAIPVVGSEPPIVYTHSNAHNIQAESKFSGQIARIERDKVIIKNGDSTYTQNFPNSMKSSFHTQCKFKCMLPIGSEVKVGDPLFRLDGFDNGIHTGINVKVAYMHVGGDYEDGIVLREGILPRFGHKLTKKFEYEVDNYQFYETDEPGYVHGLPSIGTKLEYGQPIVKGITRVNVSNKVLKELGVGEPTEFIYRYPIDFIGTVASVKVFTNATEIPPSVSEFIYPNPGSDVTKIEIEVDYLNIPKLGDKFTTMYGCKGTVCKIIPDEEMYETIDGEKIDVIISPSTTIGRKGLSALKVGFLSELAKMLWIKHGNELESKTPNYKSMKSEVAYLLNTDSINSMTDDEFRKFHNSFKSIKSYRIKTKTMESRFTYDELNKLSEKFGLDLECLKIVRNNKFIVKRPMVVNTIYLNRLHFIAQDKQSATPFMLPRAYATLGAKNRPSGQAIGEQELFGFMAQGVSPDKVLKLEREQLGSDLVMNLLLLGQGLDPTDE